MKKRIFQLLIVAAILVASLGTTGSALAWSNCASHITVQWGDTLSGIAAQCNTTVYAIQAANPGLGSRIYAGQVLYIPSGSSNSGYYPPVQANGTYVVQWGDTLGKIAARTGTSVHAILAVNPQIYNPSLIFAGQVIYLPVGSYPPPPPPPPPPCNTNCQPTPPPTCSTQCPPPPPGDGLSTLKINYKGGMYIRTEPNGKVIASALNKETVYYYPNSTFRIGGCVWVKVKVFPPTKGYYEGWLLVRDQLYTYFTTPQID